MKQMKPLLKDTGKKFGMTYGMKGDDTMRAIGMKVSTTHHVAMSCVAP